MGLFAVGNALLEIRTDLVDLWRARGQTDVNAISSIENLEISDDKSRLDVDVIHSFLKRSHWAARRTRETLIRSIEHSLCFGAYVGSRQIAFARVVTDRCTFSYLCDVFVDEAYRGKGVSKALMATIMKHPDLVSFRRFTLATKDAHGLYRKFGFNDVEQGRFMEIKRDGV